MRVANSHITVVNRWISGNPTYSCKKPHTGVRQNTEVGKQKALQTTSHRTHSDRGGKGARTVCRACIMPCPVGKILGHKRKSGLRAGNTAPGGRTSHRAPLVFQKGCATAGRMTFIKKTTMARRIAVCNLWFQVITLITRHRRSVLPVASWD